MLYTFNCHVLVQSVLLFVEEISLLLRGDLYAVSCAMLHLVEES